MFLLFVYALLSSIMNGVVQSGYSANPATQRRMSAHKQVATWEEAKQRCEREGATLASPTDAALLKYMKSVITVNNHTTPYFLGIKAIYGEDVHFVSEEGIPLEDLQEALDMIEQLDSQKGDCLCMDGHSIRVVSCWTRLPYICYKNVTEEATTAETPATTPTDCNTGYKLDLRSGSYYKLHDDKAAASWDVANSTCTAEGGYLAILYNTYEARTVTYEAFPLGSYRYAFVWIGLRDTTGNGHYQSVHGDPIQRLYNIFQKKLIKYDCVVLRLDEKLESWPCSDKLPFVCEKNILDTC